MLVDFGNLTDR